mmetsp:Transcript_24535/g.52030  ORF Transcript_24535/g.52030 Transcript_24535/m.52030 type:complete len:653 (+) Transcript_24535:269-2227(+)
MCQSQSSDSGGKGVNGLNLRGSLENENGVAPPTTQADAKDASSSDNLTDDENSSHPPLTSSPSSLSTTSSSTNTDATQQQQLRRRRKRDRQASWSKHLSTVSNATTTTTAASGTNKRIVKKKKKSKMASKHGDDAKSGGLDALIPSLIGVVVLAFVILARMGFRGRATVAGIDLGTTNSVICVQAPAKGLGEIECIADPATGSPVVPSVVSFLDHHHARQFRLTKEQKEQWWPELVPHPVDAVVGRAAKERITSHPHHTVYHAKRIIGREYGHASVDSLRGEVDFDIVSEEKEGGVAAFQFPYHMPPSSSAADPEVGHGTATVATLTPSEVGAYILHHLRTLTRTHLGHDNVKSAVIAIPAKFEPAQRDATLKAYELAGLKVTRVVEEPTAAALAYGLHKRDDVHHVMVYDFGGGTLDISMLYIGEGGYIEVLGSDGDERLGGADFDAAVAHWLLEKKGGESIVHRVMASLARIEENMGSDDAVDQGMDVEDLIESSCDKLKETPLCTISSLHTMGERMKIALSDHPNEPEFVAEETCYRLPPPSSDDDEVAIPSSADELCSSIYPIQLSLTLSEYDLAVEPLYQKSLAPIRRLLKDLDLQKEEIDEVVMVGGTTRMPQIRELVRVELEKERLNTHIDPDLTVAYGAASVID